MDDDMLIDIAREKLSGWLVEQEKMDGKPPEKIEFVLAIGDETIENRLFLVFRFKINEGDKWLLGVAGGFTDEESTDCPMAYSSFFEYPDDKTEAVRAAYIMAFFAMQREKARAALLQWLTESDEMDGEPPSEMEYAFVIKGEESFNRKFFVFRFKGIKDDDDDNDDDDDKWLIGIAGGYSDEESLDCSIAFSRFDEFPEDKDEAVSLAFSMAVYVMRSSSTRTPFQIRCEQNKRSVGKPELDAEKIAGQFVKTGTRDFVTIGTVDVPSGRVMVSDPLGHLAGKRIAAPILEKEIPKGSYPVEVSLFRGEQLGIRICTVRLKIKKTAAVRYELAEATPETALMTSTFPVDSGVMCFIDADGAEDYRRFDDEWWAEHPGGNHYTDYFAALFAESYERLPDYQRKDGDFIEWTNPENGERMIMVASGIGYHGFYRCFWGYDEDGELCELAVPMIDPDIFERSDDDLYDDDDDDEDDLNTRWQEAYRANPHAYGMEDGGLLVDFALTEDTDSLFPLVPEEHWASEGKTINKWIISIVSITKDSVLGTIEYHEAIKRLEKHFLAEKDGWTLIEGLTLEQLEELFDGLPQNAL